MIFVVSALATQTKLEEERRRLAEQKLAELEVLRKQQLAQEEERLALLREKDLEAARSEARRKEVDEEARRLAQGVRCCGGDGDVDHGCQRERWGLFVTLVCGSVLCHSRVVRLPSYRYVVTCVHAARGFPRDRRWWRCSSD